MIKKQFTEKEFFDLQTTYGTFESFLKYSGFEVLGLVRDIRHDWADDGGYAISISTLPTDDYFYLHIISINYNNDIECHKLKDDQEGYMARYIKFHSLEDLKLYMNELLYILKNNPCPDFESECYEFGEDGNIVDYGDDMAQEYFEEEFPELHSYLSEKTPMFKMHFGTMFTPFLDHPTKNEELIEELLDFTTNTYKPNFVYYGDDENDTMYEEADFIIGSVEGVVL